MFLRAMFRRGMLPAAVLERAGISAVDSTGPACAVPPRSTRAEAGRHATPAIAVPPVVERHARPEAWAVAHVPVVAGVDVAGADVAGGVSTRVEVELWT